MNDAPVPIVPSAPSPALLIDVREVANLTSLGDRTVWRLAQSGRLPLPLKVGGRRLWSRLAIEKWIQSGCPRTGR
jgi:excisionase family DNA binding protein